MEWTRIETPGFAAVSLNRRPGVEGDGGGVGRAPGVDRGRAHAQQQESANRRIVDRSERSPARSRSAGGRARRLADAERGLLRAQPLRRTRRRVGSLDIEAGRIDRTAPHPHSRRLAWLRDASGHGGPSMRGEWSGVLSASYSGNRLGKGSGRPGPLGRRARLADVLERSGNQVERAHVHVLGLDGPPNPKTPPFFRSLPIDKALHPDTILATKMNGAADSVHPRPARCGWSFPVGRAIIG